VNTHYGLRKVKAVVIAPETVIINNDILEKLHAQIQVQEQAIASAAYL
jgi:hypothetical protein